MVGVYDVCVVGGGPVGRTLAALLSSNLKVCIVDPVPFTFPSSLSTAPGIRVWALSPSSKSTLASANVHPDRITPFKRMRVLDWASSSSLDWDGDPLGYIVENDALLAALPRDIEQVVDSALVITEPGVLKLESGKEIKSRLIVGADGDRSVVKRRTGHSGSVGFEYDQNGIVVSVKLRSGSEDLTAWQRFLPAGPLALLPCSPPYASVVWSTSSEHALLLKNLPEKEFISELNNAFRCGYNAGPVPHCFPPPVIGLESSRASFPLRLRTQFHYVESKAVLIGDAAHIVHPLAGQGLNLGIGDASSLAGVILRAERLGLDIGSESVLFEFERKQQLKNQGLLWGVHTIKELFSIDSIPVSFMRGTAIHIINKSSFLKNKLAQFAMG